MPPFHFKQFSIAHDRCAHKVGTDGVLLGAWVEAENPQHILDVGTGSGLIALMLAQRFLKSKITGIELDQPSAEQANENVTNSPFSNRIEIINDDFLTHAFTEKYDLIISNPPFFKGNTSSGKTERDRARHEEYLPQNMFLEKAASLLSSKGKLAVILPKEEAQEFIFIAETFSLFPSRLTKVYGRLGAEDKRWLLEMEKEKVVPSETGFILRDEKGRYTMGYRNMTEQFHLDF